MAMKFRLMGALFGAVAMASAANAATVVVTGNTTGKPVLANPYSGYTTNYQTHLFHVTQSGSYSMGTLSNFDAMLFIYQGSFQPANPAGSIALDDDDANWNPANGLDSYIVTNLVAGHNYYAVVTGYWDGAYGSYSLVFDGPGAAVMGQVPEPATWAMMIVGAGATGGAMRRRRKLAMA